MAFDENEVMALVKDEFAGIFATEKSRLDQIDRWARWEHDEPHKPRHATPEYQELAKRAQAPWGDLVVTTVAQTLYVAGYRRGDQEDNSTPWRVWQANGMDARQIALHRAALTYGLAYVTVVPGRTALTGEAMPMMRAHSPRKMLALYEDPEIDEFPIVAIRVTKRRSGFVVEVYDDKFVHTLTGDKNGGGLADKLEYRGAEEHGAGVCPVVRFANRFDLEGRSAGEIEPLVSVLGRIDQTSMDRLVVQRFAAWIVRTIAGMSITETAAATGRTEAQVKQELRPEDLLVAEDPDTKFGSLPATPLDGFINAHEADVGVLAAVSQTPAHELNGKMANLSAEALAAARAGATAKSDERKVLFGEAHGQALRLAAHILGDAAAAADFEAQIRWRDTSIRSMAQAADALGKLADQLEFPRELLWEKIPGVDELDLQRARTIVEKGTRLEQLLTEIAAAQGVETAPAPAA